MLGLVVLFMATATINCCWIFCVMCNFQEKKALRDQEGSTNFTPNEKLKEIMKLLLLNIALPTLNIFTDLYMITRLFVNGDAEWACVLATFFILNYILTWFAWWRLDSKKHISSKIAVAVACYPQYVATEAVYFVWNDMKSDFDMKKKLEREVSEPWVYVEAVPTFFILGFLYFWQSYTGFDEVIGAANSTDELLFIINLVISAVAATIGIVMTLKVEPCRLLRATEGQRSHGLFLFAGLLRCLGLLLLTMSVIFTMVSKAAAMGWMMLLCIYVHEEWDWYPPSFDDHSLKCQFAHDLFAGFCLLFLPQLVLVSLLVFQSFWRTKDRKDTWKTIISHPSLLVLPLFTYYTFSSPCCSIWRKFEKILTCRKLEEETGWRFSPMMTYINIVLSAVGHMVLYVKFVSHFPWGYDLKDLMFVFPKYYKQYPYFVFLFPVAISSIGLTLLTLWVSCCCCRPLQSAVFKPNGSLKDQNGGAGLTTMGELEAKTKVNKKESERLLGAERAEEGNNPGRFFQVGEGRERIGDMTRGEGVDQIRDERYINHV